MWDTVRLAKINPDNSGDRSSFKCRTAELLAVRRTRIDTVGAVDENHILFEINYTLNKDTFCKCVCVCHSCPGL